jgi:hypothetical protein
MQAAAANSVTLTEIFGTTRQICGNSSKVNFGRATELDGTPLEECRFTVIKGACFRWREPMLNRLLAMPASWRPILGPIMVLALLGASGPLTPADAGGIGVTSCVGSFYDFSCVERWSEEKDDRSTPRFRDPEDAAKSAERERLWTARCRPVLKQDRYGVERYHYAAPGCEYGRFQD